MQLCDKHFFFFSLGLVEHSASSYFATHTHTSQLSCHISFLHVVWCWIHSERKWFNAIITNHFVTQFYISLVVNGAKDVQHGGSVSLSLPVLH